MTVERATIEDVEREAVSWLRQRLGITSQKERLQYAEFAHYILRKYQYDPMDRTIIMLVRAFNEATECQPQTVTTAAEEPQKDGTPN